MVLNKNSPPKLVRSIVFYVNIIEFTLRDGNRWVSPRPLSCIYVSIYLEELEVSYTRMFQLIMDGTWRKVYQFGS